MVSNNRDSVPNAVIPNPDPSLITAQAIDRAVDNSKAIVDTRIDGMEKAVAVFQADLTRVPTTLDRAVQSLRELIETRLDGMDRDMGGIHHTVDQRGADIREQIEHLKELAFGKIEELASVTKEKFEGVAAQFSERDTRTDQRAGDTKLAVDAAFAAAKEATSKIVPDPARTPTAVPDVGSIPDAPWAAFSCPIFARVWRPLLTAATSPDWMSIRAFFCAIWALFAATAA